MRYAMDGLYVCVFFSKQNEVVICFYKMTRNYFEAQNYNFCANNAVFPRQNYKKPLDSSFLL